MENATQALIIAGGILVAILILSIGVTIYNTHSKTAEAVATRWSTVELNKYNSSFQVYEARTDVTAQDIVSLVSLSQQRNGAIAVKVRTTTGSVKGNNNLTSWNKDKLNQFLSDHILTTVKSGDSTVNKNTFSYVTDSIKYDAEGKICEIAFKEN